MKVINTFRGSDAYVATSALCKRSVPLWKRGVRGILFDNSHASIPHFSRGDEHLPSCLFMVELPNSG